MIPELNDELNIAAIQRSESCYSYHHHCQTCFKIRMKLENKHWNAESRHKNWPKPDIHDPACRLKHQKKAVVLPLSKFCVRFWRESNFLTEL